ncbi:MAG: fused MFS/spermidine synthase [Acidobacteriaceae bacterium]
MLLLLVFAVSMFAGAGLLFVVEPMLAKMALPLFGGAPSVWNAALVFYQAMLLAGYLYAWAAAKWLGRRTQIVVHLCVALLCLMALPPRIPHGWEPPATGDPVWSLLGILAVAVGLPFFFLSSSTPMLQRWFAHSAHRSANDPYFLYSASNAGSLIGLLGYPFLIEPTLRLGTQSRWWGYGYAVFVGLTLVCGALIWRANPAAPASATEEPEPAEDHVPVPRRLRWIALAFVPSSLMMGVTTGLTTDVPAIPLLWVIPLAVYLLSFIFVFARRPLISHQWLVRRLPLLLLLTLLPAISKVQLPFSVLFPLYLITLFAVAMVCHGELARSRPAARHLNEFYLWISLGGVLGGVFNALLAPVLFSTVLELPLALIFAAFLRPAPAPDSEKAAGGKRRNDWLLPALLGLTMAAVIEIVLHRADRRVIAMRAVIYILVFGYSMLWCLSFGRRPRRFALGMVALLLASSLYQGPYGAPLFRKRNFFGVLRVVNDPAGKFRYLFFGAIVHGIQNLDPAKSREPLSYYTPSGPAGSILDSLNARTFHTSAGATREPRWAVVGLGAGSMACYRTPGESLTFYEIDPASVQIASDPHLFTFLSQCAPQARIVLGDARLRLRDAPDAGYDLIVLDAFSGDTVPMHLLTREALALYLRKLAPGGLLAFHISNLHLRLEPPLAALAHDAGLTSMIDNDTRLTRAQEADGKLASRWMVMARNPADLGELASDPRWQPAPLDPKMPVWTDDYSSLVRVIIW